MELNTEYPFGISEQVIGKSELNISLLKKLVILYLRFNNHKHFKLSIFVNLEAKMIS